jgi:superfamily II DNA or RNA helicase
MSVLVNRTLLKREDEERIVKLLTIQPIEKPHSRYGGFQRQADEGFSFFSVEGNYVRLPYAFAKVLLGYHPNEKRDYQSIKVKFGKKLRPRQEKKVAKIDSYLDSAHTALFCGHTGFGKTLMANYYIAKLQLLTVVLVPGSQLMFQWPAAIRETLPGVRVGMVGEDYPITGDEEMDVLVCMPERWSKIPEEVRDKVGFVIVDEAHMFCAKTRSVALLQFQPRYVLALTASPRRTDGTFGVIQALCGLDCIRARYKNPVTVWKFQTGLEFPTAKNIRGKTDWANTVKKMVENDDYNELIADLAVYLVKEMQRKPLFMCDRKEHVKILTEKTKAKGVTCDYLMENKNTYTDSEALFAIVQKAGTGFDEQYACPDYGGKRIDCVVYCTSLKEINGLIQYGGRAFRAEEPLLIHLSVKNSIMEGHWRENKRYYLSKEYLANVTIRNISSSDIWQDV